MVIPNPLLDPLKSILVYNRRRIYIDNVYFRLHYVWTVIILLAFAILVTSKIYVGDPINCMSSGDVKDIVKQYCLWGNLRFLIRIIGYWEIHGNCTFYWISYNFLLFAFAAFIPLTRRESSIRKEDGFMSQVIIMWKTWIFCINLFAI